jgi:hypothetical protein
VVLEALVLICLLFHSFANICVRVILIVDIQLCRAPLSL